LSFSVFLEHSSLIEVAYPSNIFYHTLILMSGRWKVHKWGGFQCHAVHTDFQER